MSTEHLEAANVFPPFYVMFFLLTFSFVPLKYVIKVEHIHAMRENNNLLVIAINTYVRDMI